LANERMYPLNEGFNPGDVPQVLLDAIVLGKELSFCQEKKYRILGGRCYF
jgi:hypothetical protein